MPARSLRSSNLLFGKKPRYRYALGAGLAIALILLSDFYYLIYSAIIAMIIVIYFWRKKALPISRDKKVWGPILVFLLIASVLAVTLPLHLLLANSKDPLLGAHDASHYSTDLLSPLIDGGNWRFGHITSTYWRNVKAGRTANTVYLSLAVVVVSAVGLIKRKKIHADLGLWLIVAVVFMLLSLGPRLLIIGHIYNNIPLPYALLVRFIPTFKLSGVPVRMMSMTILATSVVSAMVLSKLNLKKLQGRAWLTIFFVVLFIELWPAPLPLTRATYPNYAYALKNLPMGSVIDRAPRARDDEYARPLYNQTLTEKPIAFGYISRTPNSVDRQDKALLGLLNSDGGVNKICELYGTRYLTEPASKAQVYPGLNVVYRDDTDAIYDLKNSDKC